MATGRLHIVRLSWTRGFIANGDSNILHRSGACGTSLVLLAAFCRCWWVFRLIVTSDSGDRDRLSGIATTLAVTVGIKRRMHCTFNGFLAPQARPAG